MLSLPLPVCRCSTCTRGCMLKQPCISMRHLPSLTSLQPGLLQATMQRQQVLEAQATEFLQWLADSQSCHRAWQLEDWDKDWDPEEPDAPKDAPAAQSGQLSFLALYPGTPWRPGRGNPLAFFLDRCAQQQPWPVKCCWQGVPQALPYLCGCASFRLDELGEGRHKQLCMLCHHKLWSPALIVVPSMCSSCFGPCCRGPAVCQCRCAMEVAIMLCWCHRAGIPVGAWVPLAWVGWALARALARTCHKCPQH